MIPSSAADLELLEVLTISSPVPASSAPIMATLRDWPGA